jgi:ribosomal-protein-alanine N-acetyltransferase
LSFVLLLQLGRKNRSVMLRILHEDDFPQLLIIERLTQAAPWTLEVFERCLQVGYLGWVIEENKRIWGFVLLSLQVGEGHILNICVHPDFQRQGVGQELIEHALGIAKAKGAAMVFLEVRRSNKGAIALYEKMDFVQIGERKAYYPLASGREDALVFAKDLGVQ